MEVWPAIVFGWPAIFGAIALSIAGIIHRRTKLLVVAAIVALPFSFYLAGSPVYGWFGLVMPLSLIGAAIASYHHYTKMAWSFLTPFIGISGWLAILVLSE